MKKIITIAWRNIWRNRTRSSVVIIAIMIGLIGGIFLISFGFGMQEGRTRSIIETQISHIQIHTPTFLEDRYTKDTLPQKADLVKTLDTLSIMRGYSLRTLVGGMANSAKAAGGVSIQGIDPAAEAVVTQLPDRIIEGAYFEGVRRNPVLIGQKLAEKLKVSLKKKIILTFQDKDGEITSGAFRIAGIYKSINSKYDETNVFVRAQDLQKILGQEGQIHEVAILLESDQHTFDLQDNLQMAFTDYQIDSWKETSPDLKLIAESLGASLGIFMSIIMLGLAFGIINTMLMAVLERTRELGMLMSIGMNKRSIFSMIMLETFFLSMVGVPIGLFIAFGLVSYFGNVGIDMSAFSDGLNDLGYSNIAYTSLDPSYYTQIAIMVAITALLSAIYPALRALRLKPAEAVRSL
ncbi:MAG: FtsX-like permease family protein [Bacteroidota bacterium]